MMNAVEGVGREVLVIKGTEIIGTVKVETMRMGLSLSEAAINFTEEMYDKFVAPLVPPSTPQSTYPRHKLTFIRFSTGLGFFMQHNVWPGGEALDDWLEDVRIVDKDYFEWGMVPDTFQDVPGFGARRQQLLS